MKQFWNDRYNEQEFVYGIEPNLFFKEELNKLMVGSLLLPAEGEGRNAVYAASQKWAVTAFDYSEEGRVKAMKLAKAENITFNYIITDYENCDFEENSFDAIALIYTHAPNWQTIYSKLFKYLKPGGTLILELFNKKQLPNNSGGPKNENLLVNADELEAILTNFQTARVWEDTCVLDEGKYHSGTAEVVRCVAKK